VGQPSTGHNQQHWSTLCERELSRSMRQMVVTPDSLWPTDAYLYSQSCEIHRLGPNEFISIDWFPL
jgi:hypothetical protein